MVQKSENLKKSQKIAFFRRKKKIKEEEKNFAEKRKEKNAILLVFQY